MTDRPGNRGLADTGDSVFSRVTRLAPGEDGERESEADDADDGGDGT